MKNCRSATLLISGLLASSVSEGQTGNGKFTSCRSENDDWALHAPDAGHLHHTPIKTVALYFHFIRNAACENNFSDQTKYTALNYAKDVEEAINLRLAANDTMKAPLPDGCKSEYIADTRIRIKVMGADFLPCDDDCNSYGGIGRHASHPCDCFVKYNVNEDKYINIYFMEDGSPENRAGGEAYHLGTCLNRYTGRRGDTTWSRPPTRNTIGIRIEGLWGILASRDYGIWQAHNVVMHELGHIIGNLHHSWTYKDYQGSKPYDCCDTPFHNSDPSYNNQMDYGMGERGFTQCQIGFIHRTLTEEYFSYLVDDYCRYDAGENIVIGGKENITWHTARMLRGDLIIRDRSTLTVRCGIGLPAEARVIVEAGSQLILDGGILTNICEETWKGVLLHSDVRKPRKNREREGRLELVNGGRIERAAASISRMQTIRGRATNKKRSTAD